MDATPLEKTVESLSCSVDSSASIESRELDDGNVPFVPAWQRLLDEAGPPDFETSPVLAAAERELWDATPHHKPRRPHHRSAPPLNLMAAEPGYAAKAAASSELTHEIDESEQEERAALDIFYRRSEEHTSEL